MRRKIREKGELERTRVRKEKELEMQAHNFYFYKIYVPYTLANHRLSEVKLQFCKNSTMLIINNKYFNNYLFLIFISHKSKIN